MNAKIVAILLIITHMSGNFASAIAGAGLPENCASCAPLSFEVDSGTEAMIAVINKNLRKQLKYISELADLSSALAGKALPERQKDKPVKNNPPVCLLPANSFNNERQFGTVAFDGLHLALNPASALTLLIFALVLYLSIRRQKIRKCFYVLARGAIEDAISFIKKFIINPHRRNAAGGFL